MRTRAILGVLVALTALGCWIAFAQDGEAPPAIAQGGVTNWASRMPSQLAAGGVAPGSLIRIRGWRLNASIENLKVRIRRGEKVVQASPLAVTENELEVLVPAEAPTGDAMLQVVKNGSASLEWPVVIAERSFGAFSRNGDGWGPGEISNSGAANSEAHPARPGEMVTLAGTGLGAGSRANAPEVLVAGRAAKRVRVTARDGARRGVDFVEFEVPRDTPEGCHVPVQVTSAPGIYSNAVTLAVTRNGAPCARGGWSGGGESQRLRMATVALLHADLLLTLTPTQTARFPVDAGFASFATVESGASANPLFLLPPADACTTYSSMPALHSITSPLAALEALPGTPLDAGPSVTVAGASGNRLLPRDQSPRQNYWAVLGGHSPAPGAKELPLFLTPGEYLVSTRGAAGVRDFHVSLRAKPPLDWQNREQLTVVDRALGATVSWRAASGPTPSYVLIVAMNTDSRSGALGVCACVAKAGDGSFKIPAYALANIPPTPEHPRGFPLNLVLLAEIPQSPAAPATGMDIDRILAFAASISGRTVQFR